MINFKQVKLENKNLFDLYFIANNYTICDWTFANIFCWQNFYKTQWAEVENFLIVRFYINGSGKIGYMLLRKKNEKNFNNIISILSEDAHLQGQPLILTCLSDKNVEILKNMMPNIFIFGENRNFDDYVYKALDLKELKGRKYAAKRNHINKFISKYKFNYEPLTKDKFEECIRLYKKWWGKRSTYSALDDAEQQVIEIAFENFELLQLFGGVLYVGIQMIAFTFGSAINYSTFCTHIEKADTNYDGAYAMINDLFACHLPLQYVYINREDDLGIEGLRKSKLSYHPAMMKHKTLAIKINEDIRQIKEIWMRCFDDSEAFIDSFLLRYYSPENAITQKENSKIVSVSCIIPCLSEFGKTAYLFGLATLPEYRNLGFASKIVKKTLEECRKNGFDVAVQIPSERNLKKYYSRFGFIDANIHLQFATDFVLGTGSSESDMAMIVLLKNQNIEHFQSELLCLPCNEI